MPRRPRRAPGAPAQGGLSSPAARQLHRPRRARAAASSPTASPWTTASATGASSPGAPGGRGARRGEPPGGRVGLGPSADRPHRPLIRCRRTRRGGDGRTSRPPTSRRATPSSSRWPSPGPSPGGARPVPRVNAVDYSGYPTAARRSSGVRAARPGGDPGRREGGRSGSTRPSSPLQGRHRPAGTRLGVPYAYHVVLRAGPRRACGRSTPAACGGPGSRGPASRPHPVARAAARRSADDNIRKRFPEGRTARSTSGARAHGARGREVLPRLPQGRRPQARRGSKMGVTGSYAVRRGGGHDSVPMLVPGSMRRRSRRTSKRKPTASQ